jgi:hypothetical protein
VIDVNTGPHMAAAPPVSEEDASASDAGAANR